MSRNPEKLTANVKNCVCMNKIEKNLYRLSNKKNPQNQFPQLTNLTNNMTNKVIPKGMINNFNNNNNFLKDLIIIFTELMDFRIANTLKTGMSQGIFEVFC